MSQPLFSIVIPTYNRHKMLSRAVDSVLEQDWTDWELLVVDDGSEKAVDKTELLAFYPERDYAEGLQIKIIRQENTGPAAARRCGLSIAKGRYICFLDDDDYFFYNHLSTLAYSLELEDYPDCVFRTALAPVSVQDGIAAAFPNYDSDKDALLQYWQAPCGITSLCFPRSVIENVAIDPEPKIIEDFEWLSRVFTHYDLQQIDSLPTVAYFQHEHNRTLTANTVERVEERIELVAKAYAQDGVSKRVPKRVYQKMLQHQLCHAARQAFISGQPNRGWGYFRRALEYGLWGWKDLLGVLSCSFKKTAFHTFTSTDPK